MNVPSQSELEQLLKKYFGYDSFRPGQLDIINSVLSGADTLAVMPTGGGKSMCYQIPALVFPGLTVVISPLIALMQDQVSQLDEAGVPSLFLNSSLEWEEYAANMDRIRSGEIKLLYCAPETLVTERMQKLLASVKVSCFTVDEAHCISEWGHDFREEYRRIAEIRERFPDAVCLALTATATERVRSDIKTSLKLGAPRAFNEFISSFDRPNIFLEVLPKGKSAMAKQLLLGFLNTHPDESGIIYCASRRQVDELTLLLNEKRIPALSYHAGLSDEERKTNQTRFVRDEIPVIVATVAFGMGINKPNVRFVIHYDLPKSLEQYYQEIGRAGRDGDAAHALLLYSDADISKIRFFMKEKTGLELKAAEAQLQAMVDYAESRICRRKVLLSYFGEKAEEGSTGSASCCDICAGMQAGGNQFLTDVDVTIPAQKLLSAIARTEERYGASYVIDVLLGSRQQRILDNSHDKLSVWGIGKEYCKDDWFQLTKLLLQAGFIRKTSDYQVLTITQDGWDTLRERGKVMLPFVPSGTAGADDAGSSRMKFPKAGKAAERLPADDTLGRRIFEQLRNERRRLADQANVPPYVIFSDRTLEDIAVKKPHIRADLEKIYGVGETKAAKYGDFILVTVKNCEK
ncbi:MAG: DNA helicase RecQ [Treponema sp.]|nr:DNA helicase RecQ [Candidatus Treponema caballi]